VAAVAEDAATDVLSAGGSAVEAEDAAVDAAEDELVKEETEAAEDQSVPEGQVRHTVTRHTQRCTSCESERQSLARGDRKWPLDDGQPSDSRGVRVHASTGYNRVEGNRRASRNGLVSDLPPEILTFRFATFASLYHSPPRQIQRRYAPSICIADFSVPHVNRWRRWPRRWLPTSRRGWAWSRYESQRGAFAGSQRGADTGSQRCALAGSRVSPSQAPSVVPSLAPSTASPTLAPSQAPSVSPSQELTLYCESAGHGSGGRGRGHRHGRARGGRLER
jgi:hypothetical protein